MIGKPANGRKRLKILSHLAEKGKYWQSKEEKRTGKSGRNWRELEVVYLLISRLRKEDDDMQCQWFPCDN